MTENEAIFEGIKELAKQAPTLEERMIQLESKYDTLNDAFINTEGVREYAKAQTVQRVAADLQEVMSSLKELSDRLSDMAHAVDVLTKAVAVLPNIDKRLTDIEEANATATFI